MRTSAAGKGSEAPPPQARANTLPADDARRQLPDLGRESVLAGWLLEIGPAGHGFGGEPVALDWSTVADWQRLTQTALTGWQARALIAMSGEYAAMLRAAHDPTCPAPDWEPTADAQPAIQRQVRAAFAALGA